MPRSLRERLDAKIDKTGECWIWTGARSANGYGNVNLGKQAGHTTAHRAVYAEYVGTIPDGTELDHLCRNIVCVRPDQLEPVDHRTNVLRSSNQAASRARQTHCTRGHEFTPANTRVTPNGTRKCRTCLRDYQRTRRRTTTEV